MKWIEWSIVAIIVGMVALIAYGFMPLKDADFEHLYQSEEKDPLYWVAYKEITGRNLDGDLVTVKIPSGYRVCECQNRIDSVEFECGTCELFD